jgi:hypothetical protein
MCTPTAHFKLEYRCETMSLKCFVKIMHDHGERKVATASEIPESLHCSYSTNFKLIVIKLKEEPTITQQQQNPVLHKRKCHVGEKRKNYQTIVQTQNLMKSLGICSRKV